MINDLARTAYDAYGASVEWKNYQGLPMPTFEDLPPRIKDAWVAATLATVAAVEARTMRAVRDLVGVS